MMSPIVGSLAGISAQAYGLFAPPVSINSFESIATVTGNGSGSVLTFSSIPSTYSHLQIRAFIGNNGAGQTIQVKYNGDSTAGNYANHYLAGDGAGKAAGASTSSGASLVGYYVGILPSPYPTVFVMDILDYTNTNKYKTVRTLFGGDSNNTNGGSIELDSGLWLSTSAITSLTISGIGSMATTTQFALYGVK